MKHIYHIFATIALAAMPFTANAMEADMAAPELEAPAMEAPSEWTMTDDREGIENEIAEITIAVNGSQLHITNATGQTLEIYNLTGVRVATLRIDSDDKTFNVNLPKGCYMVKVGKSSAKYRSNDSYLLTNRIFLSKESSKGRTPAPTFF